MRRQHERPTEQLASLRVYEAHVGMSSEEPKVASYTEFKGAPAASIPFLYTLPVSTDDFRSIEGTAAEVQGTQCW